VTEARAPTPAQLSLGTSEPNDPVDAAASLEVPAAPGWPEPPTADAYHGVFGAIIEKLAPNTEADPVAILAQLIVACGSAIGRGPHFQVEATPQHTNEYLLLVGDTAKSRKGSSLDHVTRLMQTADPDFQRRQVTGLSSGEGVVWTLRDPQDGDLGSVDKRLLILEPEFASVLKAASREISTLSPMLRSAWDSRPLQLLTKTTPVRATDTHISILWRAESNAGSTFAGWRSVLRDRGLMIRFPRHNHRVIPGMPGGGRWVCIVLGWCVVGRFWQERAL
jgi:hypothetical protein